MTPRRPARTARAGRRLGLAALLLLATACSAESAPTDASPPSAPPEEPLVPLAEASDMPSPPSLRAAAPDGGEVTVDAIVAFWAAAGTDASIEPPTTLEWVDVRADGEAVTLSIGAPAEPSRIEVRASPDVDAEGLPEEERQISAVCAPQSRAADDATCVHRLSKDGDRERIEVRIEPDVVADAPYLIVYGEWAVVDEAGPGDGDDGADGVHENSASWAVKVV